MEGQQLMARELRISERDLIQTEKGMIELEQSVLTGRLRKESTQNKHDSLLLIVCLCLSSCSTDWRCIGCSAGSRWCRETGRAESQPEQRRKSTTDRMDARRHRELRRGAEQRGSVVR